MNALVFLGIAAMLSVAGCGILWLRSRQPGSMEAHIEEFARELDALAPGAPSERARRIGPRNVRGGLDRLPDQGAGPERPERPRLAPGETQSPNGPPTPGFGPARPPGRRPGPERPPDRGATRPG